MNSAVSRASPPWMDAPLDGHRAGHVVPDVEQGVGARFERQLFQRHRSQPDAPASRVVGAGAACDRQRLRQARGVVRRRAARAAPAIMTQGHGHDPRGADHGQAAVTG